MEKVLFDYTYYQKIDTFHGGGEYGNVILMQLLDREITGFGLFFFEHSHVNLEVIDMVLKKGWNVHPISDIRNVSSIVKKYEYTTVYSPIPYDPMWDEVNLPDNVRFVGTFHGLRTIESAPFDEDELSFYDGAQPASDYIYTARGEKSDNAVNRYGKALFAFKNKRIITVSEHSKYSMHYYFPQLNLQDVDVLYSPQKSTIPVDNQKYESEILSELCITDRNYGLIISAGIYRKNPLRGVMAYDQVFSYKYDEIPSSYKVVVLGIKDENIWRTKIKNPDRFIFKGYVKDVELEVLYKHAHLFLYPTLNEGFGYPPLEAMKYGTLCACSSNTALPEICGDMVLLFNPLLIDEIAIRILQSFSEEIRNEKVKSIKERLPKIQKKQQEDLKKLINLLIGEENG